MRITPSVLPLLCLSIWSACNGDDPRAEWHDGAPPGALGADASQVLALDGGGAPVPGSEAGVVATSGSDASGAPPVSADAASDAGSLLQGDAGAGSACPAKFTTASYMQMQMSWPGSIGFLAGADYARAWAKTTFTRSADGMTTDSVLCGVAFPIVRTTLLLGEIQLANDFPLSAFEQPTMPRAKGRATWQNGKLVIDVGASVLGAALGDPYGAWPTREALASADHDGDGKPGITVLPRKDPPFGLPPGDLLMTVYLDAMYTASRMGFRLTGTSEGCSAPAEGDVEPLAFNYTVIGCHIVDGGDCGEGELNLIENQSPLFTPMAGGRWKSVPIAENASCSDVRNAIPAQ